jgi:PAS domain S-box-containing protein
MTRREAKPRADAKEATATAAAIPAAPPRPTDERVKIVAVALLAVAAASLTFALDLHLPLGISVVTPYVGVVLLGLWMGRTWIPILLAAVTTVLAIVGYLYSPPGGDHLLGIANRAFAVGSFWLTALLCFWYATSAGETAKERAHLKAVVDVSPNDVFTIDDRATIRSLNRSGQALFGYSEADIVGENLRRLVPSSTCNDGNRSDAGLLETPDREAVGKGCEVQARRKDGGLFPAYLAIGRIDGRDSPLFVGVLHDISDRRRAERELRENEARYREIQAELFHVSRLGDWRRLSPTS